MILALLLAAAQTPVRPAIQRYTVDAKQSELGFDGSSSLHDFTGRTKNVRGELTLCLPDPRMCARGRVLALASSLDTDSSGRDEDMHELLEVDAHTNLVFRIERSGPLPVGWDNTTIQGAFSVRGVEVPKEVQVEVLRLADGALRIRGRSRVKMSAFGIKPPKVLFIKTADEVETWWDLMLVPVAAKAVAAQSYVIEVNERFQRPGGEVVPSQRHSERLWVSERGSLWERGGSWHVASSEGVCAIDVARGSVLAPAEPAETAFGELALQLDKLRADLATAKPERRESLASNIATFEKMIALAPASAEPEVDESEGVVVRIGGTTWLEVHGRRGDGNFAALLATLDGFPRAVRDVLASLEGVPERVIVRSATLAGAQTLEIQVGAAEVGELPDWALAPSSWCRASTDE